MVPSDQRESFAREGYLAVPDLLAPLEIERCNEEIGQLHKVAAGLERQDQLADSTFQREPHSPDQHEDSLPVLRKIEDTGKHSGLFYQLARHGTVIETVKALLKSKDLLLFRSTLMLKPAHHGSAHALHQDSAYWPIDPPTLITVSIALTDATRENGCFQVIPRSHKWGLQDWGGIILTQDEGPSHRDDVDLNARIDVPLKAGSALFFHSLLIHGSGANASAHPRHTALYTYFSPQVSYCPKGEGGTRTFPVVAGLNDIGEHTLVAAYD